MSRFLAFFYKNSKMILCIKRLLAFTQAKLVQGWEMAYFKAILKSFKISDLPALHKLGFNSQ
jgi:hypothetical protein